MSYAQKIKDKKFPWGGRALVTPFPASGLVSVAGSIAVGSRKTSDDTLADVHAQMLLEGTEQYSKKDLQIELDRMGASLAFNASSDRLRFSALVRATHLPQLCALVSEILRHPAFPETELSILKQREEASLRMESQHTLTQAKISLSRMLYPKDHPNYAPTTSESVAALKKISVPLLRAYHAHINRNSLVLSVSGDVSTNMVFDLAQQYFAVLPSKKIPKQKTLIARAPKAQRKATYIKEKASTDYIIASSTRITNTHKDFAALQLGMQILGNRGGFTGRLMRTVREQEGLTYVIYSALSGFAYDTDGHIQTWANFAPQLFDKGRAATLREINRLVTEGVTEDEVRKHAKLYEAGRRVGLSSASTLARVTHDIVVDNKPLSYLDDYPQKILKLSTKEVNRVLKKYLNPKAFVESAAGPIKAIKG